MKGKTGAIQQLTNQISTQAEVLGFFIMRLTLCVYVILVAIDFKILKFQNFKIFE